MFNFLVLFDYRFCEVQLFSVTHVINRKYNRLTNTCICSMNQILILQAWCLETQIERDKKWKYRYYNSTCISSRKELLQWGIKNVCSVFFCWLKHLLTVINFYPNWIIGSYFVCLACHFVCHSDWLSLNLPPNFGRCSVCFDIWYYASFS